MSYFGLDGRVDTKTANNLLATSNILKHAGIDEDLVIDLNDSFPRIFERYGSLHLLFQASILISNI
jgi:hypothetical protein